MTGAATEISIGYFGKIPSRGDFVKATDNTPLVGALDSWLSRTMDLLAADPRWRLAYDAAFPMHFAFLGPRSRHAIAGHLIASSDQAGRRYPFLATGSMELDTPADFVLRSPLVLSRLWTRLALQMEAVMSADDPAIALQTIAGSKIPLEISTLGYDAAFADFLEMQNIGSLNGMLAQTGFTGTARHLILALGILLQPVMASTSCRLDKSLVLPLPADPMYRFLVAAYWMQLVTPFLLRRNFEMSMFFTRHDTGPAMVLGFSGASPHTLHALLAPHAAADHLISFGEAHWVEEQLLGDYGIRKLASYLSEPGLLLKSAQEAFLEVFTGA